MSQLSRLRRYSHFWQMNFRYVWRGLWSEFRLGGSALWGLVLRLRYWLSLSLIPSAPSCSMSAPSPSTFSHRNHFPGANPPGGPSLLLLLLAFCLAILLSLFPVVSKT